MSETNRIEYKLELTKDLDLEKEVVAFLNYHEGGIIYIGIDKHGVVQGVKDLDGDMLKIKDRIKMSILPSCMGLFDVSAEVREGRDVIKIILASGSEKPYYKKKYGMSEKGCYIRSGTAADPMPTKMIEELFAKRTRNSMGKIKSAQQDLTFAQLKIYYQAKGIVLNSHFAKNLELLTEDGSFNYAAYLMADKNGTSVKVAKYKGITREELVESAEYGYESLVKATKQVLDKIEIENTISTEITSKERNETNKWNTVALREAIINAFVHNNYATEVPPKFEIFDNRIEITSCGGLPEGLSQIEFFEGYSVPRNREIMRIFKDLNLVEQLGSGVPRILKAYDRDNFTFSENFIRMTFNSVIPVKDEEYLVAREEPPTYNAENTLRLLFGSLAYRKRITSDENLAFLRDNNDLFVAFLQDSFGITSGKLRESFGKASGKNPTKEFMTLSLIAICPEIKAAEIGQMLGVSERSVQSYIKSLREKQFIEREGGRKEGEWLIIEQDLEK
ncbi:MAG: ATP-dependent DNA helicase RecG [Crocinitomicaceae bacterium]|jgi:ATP-dependent DNA helicase RecG